MSQQQKCYCFVMGGPGCGKGTQCQKIVETFPGWKHISVGELLRNETTKKSSRGKRCEEYMQTGRIVPVDIVMELLQEAFEKVNEMKVLIDGFPRAADQVDVFQQQFGEFEVAWFFDCNDEVLLERLRKRSTTSGRADDTEEIIIQRLQTFRESIQPLLVRLKEIQKLREIDALGSTDDIFTLVVKEVKQMGATF